MKRLAQRFKEQSLTGKLSLTGSALVIAGGITSLASNPQEYIRRFNLENFQAPIEQVTYSQALDSFNSAEFGDKLTILGMYAFSVALLTGIGSAFKYSKKE